MKITLRADNTNESHTHLTIFVNGANCGTLCMSPDEARAFYMIVRNGCHPKLDQFLGKGHWSEASEKVGTMNIEAKIADSSTTNTRNKKRLDNLI